MSRVCVKNLPKYVDRDRLRELFSKKGEITQVMIMLTKDGKSRQFGFVGFKSEEEAAEAIKYFNNTYVGTCKITCELARKVGDSDLPQPWSRHSSAKILAQDGNQKAASNAQIQKSSNDIPKNLSTSENVDPQFQEFLQVMQPRVKSKLWSNDTAIITDAPVQDEKAVNGESIASKSERKKSEKMVLVSPDNDKKSGSLHNDVSDYDYLKSRTKKNWSDSENDDDTESKVNEESSLSHNDGRLFVHDLLRSAREDELLDLFKQFGDVKEIHIVVDKQTKLSKGMAFVRFEDPSSAERALNELRGSIFQGRLLEIQLAKPRPSTVGINSDDASQNKRSFKEKRAEQRKSSEASGDTRAWNSLFIRSDTVIENTSRRLGISKGDLVDRDAENPAVNVALGEAQVILETKKALSDAGVNVAALEEYALKKSDNVSRSNQIIIVKNLPYSSSEKDLSDMFGKFGSLEKIILPPTKALALVIFLEASEARAAFKGLAYRRYKDTPLYLEWAPSNILFPNSTSKESERGPLGKHTINSIVSEQSIERIPEDEIDLDRAESRTVFVKNLNFKTTEESLRKHFIDKMNYGSIKSVKVQKHIKNGKNVSMGFGFIEFDSVETATKVSTEFQGTVLDGHALIAKLSHSKNCGFAPKKNEKDRSLTKIIVRNVAFEAKEEDLRLLFGAYGQIKSLRLPKKFDKHRGFAFVEFVTKQEARNAMEALANTHLYGRHLVLERAKEQESLEELREKAAAHVAAAAADEPGGGLLPAKRKRSHTGNVDEEEN